MIVYHGSNMIVDQPRLVYQNRTLDFGYGFYTTTNQNQAVSFAGRVADRREGILTKEETIARLKVKKLFDQMTFTTELALKELKYIGQLAIGRDQNE